MSSGNIARLNVEFTTSQGKLDSGLRNAESKVRNSAKKMGNDVKLNLGSAVQSAATLFAVGGALEGGLKSVTALSAAFRGEWEKSADIIKTLPLGLGPVAQSIQGIFEELPLDFDINRFEKAIGKGSILERIVGGAGAFASGIGFGGTSKAADSRRFEDANKLIEKEQKRKELIEKRLMAGDKIVTQLERELQLAKATSDEERKKLQAQFKFEDRVGAAGTFQQRRQIEDLAARIRDAEIGKVGEGKTGSTADLSIRNLSFAAPGPSKTPPTKTGQDMTNKLLQELVRQGSSLGGVVVPIIG